MENNKGKNFKFATTPPEDTYKQKYSIVTKKAAYFELYPYFSFRYYDDTHRKFTFDNLKEKDLRKFFKSIKKMSQYQWKDIFTSLKKYFRAHEVNWRQTSVKQGFSNLPTELKDLPAIQFELFGESRVIGFFNKDNVFKIVWVDRYHEIYSSENY